MPEISDQIRFSGYINPEIEPDLAKAYHVLRKSYSITDLFKESLRCLARREGLLPTENDLESPNREMATS